MQLRQKFEQFDIQNEVNSKQFWQPVCCRTILPKSNSHTN